MRMWKEIDCIALALLFFALFPLLGACFAAHCLYACDVREKFFFGNAGISSGGEMRAMGNGWVRYISPS